MVINGIRIIARAKPALVPPLGVRGDRTAYILVKGGRTDTERWKEKKNEI